MTFLEDMPHIEAAARGKPSPYEIDSSHRHAVSVSGLMASISTLVGGLDLLQVELGKAKAAEVSSGRDRFIDVMEVRSSVRTITPYLTILQAIYCERAGNH